MVIRIVGVTDAGRGNCGVGIHGGFERVVQIVGELGDLPFFINDLPQSAAGILIKVRDLRTVPVLFGDGPALHVREPGRGAAHRIGQALDGPAPAPLEERDASERVSLLPHLPHIIELENRLTPGAIRHVRYIQVVVGELLERGIGMGDFDEAIHVIVIERQRVAALVGLRSYPAQRIVGGRDHVVRPGQRPVRRNEIAVGVVGVGCRLAFGIGFGQPLPACVVAERVGLAIRANGG